MKQIDCVQRPELFGAAIQAQAQRYVAEGRTHAACHPGSPRGHAQACDVVEALGAFDRHEALPYLIEALAEDDCRIIAENSLRRLGIAARPALLQAALTRRPSAINESETSLRQPERRKIHRSGGHQDPATVQEFRPEFGA